MKLKELDNEKLLKEYRRHLKEMSDVKELWEENVYRYMDKLSDLESEILNRMNKGIKEGL